MMEQGHTCPLSLPTDGGDVCLKNSEAQSSCVS